MSNEIVDVVEVELERLAACKEVILRAQRANFEGGEALHEVMDNRLYRHTHHSFEEWCKMEIGLTAHRVRQLMRSATSAWVITRKLTDPASQWVQDGNHGYHLIPKLTERVVRELQDVPVEKQADVFIAAAERSGGKVTAKVVREEVRDFKRRTTPPPLAAPPPQGTLRPEVKAAIEEGGGRFAMLAARLVELSADFKRLFEEPCGVFTNPQEIEALIDGLKRIVRFATPWADCPSCSQVGCSGCRGTGFLSRDRFDALPREVKDRSLVRR